MTAYGGARGGGKSWALRRKLVTLCLRYPGIRCLLVRRRGGDGGVLVLPERGAFVGWAALEN